MSENNYLVFSKYTMKYVGVKGHRVCNSCSRVSQKQNTYVHELCMDREREREV